MATKKKQKLSNAFKCPFCCNELSCIVKMWVALLFSFFEKWRAFRVVFSHTRSLCPFAMPLDDALLYWLAKHQCCWGSGVVLVGSQGVGVLLFVLVGATRPVWSACVAVCLRRARAWSCALLQEPQAGDRRDCVSSVRRKVLVPHHVYVLVVGCHCLLVACERNTLLAVTLPSSSYPPPPKPVAHSFCRPE